MCALRAHIKLSVFENIFSRNEKVMTAFSILEKMFPKTESLIGALRTHINRTHLVITHPLFFFPSFLVLLMLFFFTNFMYGGYHFLSNPKMQFFNPKI